MSCNYAIFFSCLTVMIVHFATGQEPAYKVYTEKYEIAIYGGYYHHYGAQQKCIDMNSSLVKIDSAEITNVIAQILPLNWYVWIGASDTAAEGDWRWMDGTKISKDAYSNWDFDEPNNRNGNEDCAVVDGRGRWADDNCAKKFGYICQKELPVKLQYGLRRYYFHRLTEHKTIFFTAIEMCKKADSRLAEIHSDDVNRVIKAQLKKANVFYWISGSDLIEEGRWMWNNKTVIGNHTWGWKSGEPNGAKSENCLAIHQNGWMDQSCGKKFAYICENEEVNAVKVSSAHFEVGSNGHNEITCTAKGYPLPRYSWIRKQLRIPFSSSNSAYQTNEKNGATLHTNKMTLLDEGEYTCWANNTVENTSFTVHATTVVKVPSHPADFAVEKYLCNSSLTISWRPNDRAVLVPHRTVVRARANGVVVFNLIQTPKDPVKIHYVTQNLQPSTDFNVSVTPCPDSRTCKTEYGVWTVARTAGIPGKVSNIAIAAISSTSCQVNWSLPETVYETAITQYQITISESIADVTSGNPEYRTVSSEVSMSYFLHGKPNRRYLFGVQAKTCAGTAPISWSDQSCVTEKQVPYIVPEADINESLGEDGEISLSVQIPNQDNGSISCLFIIVRPTPSIHSDNQTSYTMENLMKANLSISENRTEEEYVAVSLAVPRLSGRKINVVFGNGNITRCNVNTIASSREEPTDHTSFIVGQNIKLNSEKEYRIYIVSTTPSRGSVLFQTSQAKRLVAREEPGHTQNAGTTTIIAVIGACLLLISLAVGIIWRYRRSTANVKEHEMDRTDQTTATRRNQQDTEYETYNEELHSTTPTPKVNVVLTHANDGQYEEINTGAYEEIADAGITGTQHGGHYEEPIALNRVQNMSRPPTQTPNGQYEEVLPRQYEEIN